MALRIATANAIAFRAFAYTGGPLAIPFWFRRIGGATTARTILSLLDMDDADPDNNADPRIALRTVAGNLISGLYFGGGASTSDTSVATYDPADWDHVGLELDGSPGEVSLIEIRINGVGTGTPGTGARSMTLNGLIDRLQLGVNSTSHSNCEIAHLAPFAARLTNEQWLALQTMLPNAIGVAPLWYESFIGSAGSFTLSGATIDATNDSTLPELSAGDTTAPSITSTGTGATNGPFEANCAESSTAAFITLTANEPVTWSALAGADAARFQKTAESGTSVQLRPVAAFDFEDLPHANPFVVTLTATDGSGNARTVTVNATVTNVSEPPLAPTIGTATAGNATVSIAFTPPNNTGRPGITEYTATITGGITKQGAASPIVFTSADGVVNGSAYSGSVTATNADGTGPASATSNSVTPSAGAPPSPPPPPPAALTLAADDLGTVGVPGAATITNTGGEAASWSLSATPSGLTPTPASGTTAAGATTNISLAYASAATFALALASGASVTGSPQSIVVSNPPPGPPPPPPPPPAPAAGFDLHTAAGCVFGAIAGSLVGLSREVGSSITTLVYSMVPPYGLVAALPATLTGADGRLPRLTSSSLAAGTTYRLVFVWPDGDAYTINMQATA